MKAIFWISKNTFLEAVRQKFFSFLLFLVVALTAISVGISGFDFGSNELKFIADFGFGGLFLFGSILAVVMTVQLFFAEIENRTAITLLSKPVNRSAFIVGKFFGIWLLLGVFVLILSAILALVLALRQPILAAEALSKGVPEPFLSFSGLAIFAALQWIRLGIVAALTIALTSFSGTYLYAIVISFCGLLISQLQYILQDVASAEKTALPLKIAALAVTKFLPNLQIFNLGQQLVLDEKFGISSGTICEISIYGIAWSAVLICVSALFFRKREM